MKIDAICTSQQIIRNIGIIGSRSLPSKYADIVGNIVDDLLGVCRA